MTSRESLMAWLDDYVLNLRILSQRYLEADCIEQRAALLAPDWLTINWYDSLWLFELEGIKASGYPEVLDAGNVAEYCTTSKFAEFASRVALNAADSDQAAWNTAWPQLPISVIELDPRFVAFRTIHDWIVLSARVLADRSDCLEDLERESYSNDRTTKERRAPFTRPIQTEDEDGEPVGLLCGNLRERLVGGRASYIGEPGYLIPDWRQVQRPWEALRYFHCRGLILPMEFRYGPLREQTDPRLARFELLRPEVFSTYVSEVLAKDQPELSEAWRDRPAEDVRHDPRFMAHKCGFDTQIILHIAREAMTAMESEIARDDLEVGLVDSARLRALEDGEALYRHLMELGRETTDSEVDDKPEKPN